MEIKAFKIKNKEGKFSTGGYNPRWTSRGKTWGSFQAIKLHLRLFCSEDWRTKVWCNKIPEDWIVVELSAEGIKEYSAKELYPLTK